MASSALRLRPSSNVASATYNEETRELTITFKNGRSYRYPDTSPDTVAAFEEAASPGGFVHRHLEGKGQAI